MRRTQQLVRSRSFVVLTMVVALAGAYPPSLCLPAGVEVVDSLPAADKGLDLAVPDSPGFTVIGLEAQNVTRPATPRELAASLLNGVDANGNFQSGLALDTAPYMLFAGDELTIGEYRKNHVARMLARTQVSLATAKGVSGDDEAVRIGLGIRTVLWDEGDPRLDNELWDCFERVFATRPRLEDGKYRDLEQQEFKKVFDEEIQRFMDLWRASPGTGAHPTAAQERTARDAAEKTARSIARRTASERVVAEHTKDLTAYRDAREADAEQCRAQQKARKWNASGFELAAAPSAIQKPDDGDVIESNGAVFWASLAYGFEDVPGLQDSSQALLHVRYRLAEDVPIQDAEGEFRKQDTLLVGLRLRIGGSGAIVADKARFKNLNLSVEGDYVRADPRHGEVDDSYRFTVGTDLQIVKDIWLNLGVGGTGGRSDDDRLFVLASLKWGSKTFDLASVIKTMDPDPAP